MKSSYNPFFALFCIAAFFSVIYISCNKEDAKTTTVVYNCTGTSCPHGGACIFGKCICAPGYEGAHCETASREKFIGNWNVFEKGSITSAAQYAVSIQKSTSATDVVIVNFYNYYNTPVKGSVIGDTLYIPNQQYEGKIVIGKGYIYSDAALGQYGAITMRYEITDTATLLVNDFGFNATDHSDPSVWNK